MHGLIAAGTNGGAWTFGSSILTFAFPMILFVVVASALYVAYTKPELVPGHRNPAVRHSVSYTAVPGSPQPGDRDQPGVRDQPAAAGPAETEEGA